MNVNLLVKIPEKVKKFFSSVNSSYEFEYNRFKDLNDGLLKLDPYIDVKKINY